MYNLNCKIYYKDSKNLEEGLYREEGYNKEGEKGLVMISSF